MTDTIDVNADIYEALEAHEPFTYGMDLVGTGGNCTAIEVDLLSPLAGDDDAERRYIWITDREWEASTADTREERSGWVVGYYGPENEQCAETEGVDLLSTEDPSVVALVALCLRLANGPVSA